MTPEIGTGGKERNDVRPPVSRAVVYYIPCTKKLKIGTYYSIFSGFYLVWKRQEKYELVFVSKLCVSLLLPQEHALVCITRKVIRPEDGMV